MSAFCLNGFSQTATRVRLLLFHNSHKPRLYLAVPAVAPQLTWQLAINMSAQRGHQQFLQMQWGFA